MSVTCPICQSSQPEDVFRCDNCSSEIRPLPEAFHLSSPMFEADPHVRGIGGWLVLVAIGLVISPILFTTIVWRDFHVLSAPNHALIGLRVPGLPMLIAFELVRNMSMLLLALILPIFFFREKRIFPRLYQIWLALSVAAALAEFTLSFSLSASGSWDGATAVIQGLHAKLGLDAAEYVITSVIWIAYFQVSQRVKATFVN